MLPDQGSTLHKVNCGWKSYAFGGSLDSVAWLEHKPWIGEQGEDCGSTSQSAGKCQSLGLSFWNSTEVTHSDLCLGVFSDQKCTLRSRETRHETSKQEVTSACLTWQGWFRTIQEVELTALGDGLEAGILQVMNVFGIYKQILHPPNLRKTCCSDLLLQFESGKFPQTP